MAMKDTVHYVITLITTQTCFLKVFKNNYCSFLVTSYIITNAKSFDVLYIECSTFLMSLCVNKHLFVVTL